MVAQQTITIQGVPYEISPEGDALKLRKAGQEGLWYTVQRTADGYRCDCPDAQFRGRVCKHVRALKEIAAMEMKAHLPAEVPTEIVAVAAPSAPVPGPAQPLGQLARSLVQAQQECRGVSKDSTNTFHRYKYASAEAVIEEGNRALGAAGLALVPVSQTLDGHEKEGEHRYELLRKFLLIDTSGECLPIASAWPVCPDKGRPLDKATAAAATLSLAYLLRDLLLMPRVDPADDVAGRDDRPTREHRPALPRHQRGGVSNGRPPAAPPPSPPPSEEFLLASADQRDQHLAMIAEYLERPFSEDLKTDARDYLKRELQRELNPATSRLTPEDLQTVRVAWQPVNARLFPPKAIQPTQPR